MAPAPAASMLMKFGRDLTAAARKGELMPVIGRDTEVEQMQRILLRLTKNNPVIVGDPGTGKTAIVEGLKRNGSPPGTCADSAARLPNRLARSDCASLRGRSIAASSKNASVS